MKDGRPDYLPLRSPMLQIGQDESFGAAKLRSPGIIAQREEKEGVAQPKSPSAGREEVRRKKEGKGNIKKLTHLLNRSLLKNCTAVLFVLVFSTFLLSFVSNFKQREKERALHKEQYGIHVPKKKIRSNGLITEFTSFESEAEYSSGEMLDQIQATVAVQHELSDSFSPGCLAYKPGKEGGMLPLAYSNGTFHELMFKYWNRDGQIKEGLSRSIFPELEMLTANVTTSGYETAPWITDSTLYAYIPPSGFNFWLQYTSVFEPQFINILSLVDPLLRLHTHTRTMKSIIYNAVCTGKTESDQPLPQFEMGSTSATGRQLHLIALSAARKIVPTLLRPESCTEWQLRHNLENDGTLKNKTISNGSYEVAACFETLVVPRAYSLGQFYSNMRRLEYDSVHHFRDTFYSAYEMEAPPSVCERLSDAIAGGKRLVLNVGIFGREDSSHRRLTNADEVATWIKNGDIEIDGVELRPQRIKIMNGRLEDLAQVMAGLDILIAPHGAHWANAIFLPEHAVGIEVNAGCWPKPGYNPWQEFHRGSASFSHVMDSLKLRNYEIYGCSEELKRKLPKHWKGKRTSSERYNCNSLRKTKDCRFMISLDSLQAVFAQIEDKLRGEDMAVFKERNKYDRWCRNGCCSHSQIDCEKRMSPLCSSAQLPRAKRRKTTDRKRWKYDPATLPRVPQD